MAFKFKGIHAGDMKLSVLADQDFESTIRDVESLTVPGRDGELIMDRGRYESVTRKFACLLNSKDKDFKTSLHHIHQWLVADGKEHELILDDDPNFVYRACVNNSVVTTQILSHLGRAVITFRLHPVKFLKNSLMENEVDPRYPVKNPFEIEAKPVLRVVGNGNITINVGGRPLVLRGITGGCIIDSENQLITDLQGRVTLFDRMHSDFPVLAPGENSIVFPESVELFMTPRLGALV